MLAQTGSAIGGDDVDVVIGLVVGEVLHHPPHLTRSFRRQIPRFAAIVDRNTSSFRFLHASVWVHSLQRTSSRSFNLSLITFVVQQRPPIPTTFSPMCFLAAFNRIALMRPYFSSTFIFFVLQRYLAINFVGGGWKIAFLPISDQQVLLFLSKQLHRWLR